MSRISILVINYTRYITNIYCRIYTTRTQRRGGMCTLCLRFAPNYLKFQTKQLTQHSVAEVYKILSASCSAALIYNIFSDRQM